MIVVLLIDGIEVKEWWWPDVKLGFDELHHENLKRHIKTATAYCQSEVSKLVNPARCSWCVKINSKAFNKNKK